MAQSACTEPSIFVPGSASCAPALCTRGECCTDSGACTITVAANCTMPSLFTEGISACGPLCCARAAACAPTSEHITAVRLGTVSNSAPSSTACHSDSTALAPETVWPRATYPLVVTIASGLPASQVGAWFDWNNDADFDDAGEYRSMVRDPSAPANFIATVAVPAGAVIGTTKFRVRLSRTGALSPCGAREFGEIEDRSVNVQPDPCQPGSHDCGASGVYIDEVEFTNGVSNTSSTDSGCYSDFMSRTPQVVCPTRSHELVVRTLFANAQTQAAAWIDWNRNNSFTDAGEQFMMTRQPGFFSTFHASIAVPASAPLGPSRMRIRVMGPGALQPCGLTLIGEVEDYTVQVGETLGICCSETGCCTCVGFGTSLPENCMEPSTYLPCDTSCTPSTCPAPPALHAILVGGGDRLLSDPLLNPTLIKNALQRFDGVNPDHIHLAGDSHQMSNAAQAIIRAPLRSQDTLLFFFMGHGGFCEPNEPDCVNRLNLSPVSLAPQEAAVFNAPATTGTNYMWMKGHSTAHVAYYADQLAQLLQNISTGVNCRKIVVLETCFAGGFYRNLNNILPRTAFVASADGGHFSVVTGNFTNAQGTLTLALKAALDAAPASGGLPPLDNIVAALSGTYQPSCTGATCYLAIGAPTTQQDIVVTNPAFSLFVAASPDFDGSTPLSSPAPWCGPSLQSHPADVRACAGQPSILRVTHAPSAYTYQWRRAGAPIADVPGHIAGAASATLTISNASTADAGEYDCVVTNTCASITSVPATLTVCIADFDCNGATTVSDIFAFLSAWFAASPSADINGDGISVSDIFAFLTSWFAGGC